MYAPLQGCVETITLILCAFLLKHTTSKTELTQVYAPLRSLTRVHFTPVGRAFSRTILPRARGLGCIRCR